MKSIGTICLLVASQFVLAQSADDSYTRYELLDPSTKSFRIIYDVSATTPGATYYYNTLRKGSEHKVDAVVDRMTGQNLEWKIVSGADAKKTGFSEAQQDVDYLQIKLSRPVAQGDEYRIRIDKTYQDAKSYFAKDDRIVFDRPLGIKRNSIVLPKGYELVKCNFPSQVILDTDGRIKISFLNAGPSEAPLHIEARKLPASSNLTVSADKPSALPGNNSGQGRDKSKARVDFSFNERAYQDREIVYFLQQPETHAFRLHHDYTESRPGTDRYINVVRPGSKASNPSAKLLDNGQPLKVETLKGELINQRKIEIGEPVTADTEIVAIWFDPIKKGQSVRLRIEETYTDPNRYILYGDELVFDRSLGRPFNTVILPEGWFLTANLIPAVVDLTGDGKISLFYMNNSPDELDVLIRGRKR
jgi:hypothetical protein